MKRYRLLILFLAITTCLTVSAQKTDSVSANRIAPDTTIKKNSPKKEPNFTAPTKAKHDPRVATRRALMFPGLGQIYNKEYWKLPIVYGALSIPTITFFYNNTWYKRTKYAYEAKFAFSAMFDTAVLHPPNAADTANYLGGIHPTLKNLSAGSLQSYRNEFRRDRDYSVLWFLIVWGLQVADATVFAHLQQFDVSDNLSMQVKPHINPVTKNNELKLAFSFKQPTHRMINVK